MIQHDSARQPDGEVHYQGLRAGILSHNNQTQNSKYVEMSLGPTNEKAIDTGLTTPKRPFADASQSGDRSSSSGLSTSAPAASNLPTSSRPDPQAVNKGVQPSRSRQSLVSFSVPWPCQPISTMGRSTSRDLRLCRRQTVGLVGKSCWMPCFVYFFHLVLVNVIVYKLYRLR